MDITDVCRRAEGGIELDLQVSPKSSRCGIEGIDPWRKRLIVRVKAPPLDGRANKEVEEVLKDITCCKVKITAGQTSHQKTAFISGDAEEICSRLKENL